MRKRNYRISPNRIPSDPDEPRSVTEWMDRTLLDFRRPFGYETTWNIRFIPPSNMTTKKIESRSYSYDDLIAARKFMRDMSADGYHVIGRPDANRHVFVGGLTLETVRQMEADELPPSVLVNAASFGFQAWVTVSETEIANSLSSAVSQLFINRYGTHDGSLGHEGFGFIPGSRLVAPIICYAEELSSQRIPPKAEALLKEARVKAQPNG